MPPACAQGDSARAYQLSPRWSLDDEYHVEADVFLCGVGGHDGLTPRKQLSKLMLWWQRTGRLAHAVQEDALEPLGGALRRAMAPLLCTQKRQRQPRQQLLDKTPDV